MVNFGVVKTQVSRVLGEHYVNNNPQSAESVYKEYIEAVKGSQILMLEYVVFKNLEQNNMSPEKATKYLDSNIALFQRFDREDIIQENNKLKKFNLKNSLSEETVKLHEAIQDLILESTRSKGIPNINKIHDSFESILESLTKQVRKTPLVVENNEFEGFKFSDIMKITEKRITERYQHLNEDEQNILSVIVKGDQKERSELLNALKQDAIQLLSESNEDGSQEALNIIKEMCYDDDKFIDDIMSLYELIN
jgi:hypothetical protein